MWSNLKSHYPEYLMEAFGLARRVGPSQIADNKFEYYGYEPNLGLRMAILISKPHG